MATGPESESFSFYDLKTLRFITSIPLVYESFYQIDTALAGISYLSFVYILVKYIANITICSIEWAISGYVAIYLNEFDGLVNAALTRAAEKHPDLFETLFEIRYEDILYYLQYHTNSLIKFTIEPLFESLFTSAFTRLGKIDASMAPALDFVERNLGAGGVATAQGHSEFLQCRRAIAMGRSIVGYYLEQFKQVKEHNALFRSILFSVPGKCVALATSFVKKVRMNANQTVKKLLERLDSEALLDLYDETTEVLRETERAGITWNQKAIVLSQEFQKKLKPIPAQLQARAIKLATKKLTSIKVSEKATRKVIRTLEAKYAAARGANVWLKPQAAIQMVWMEMLENTPFAPPPRGCPISHLPSELLGYIFEIGKTSYGDLADRGVVNPDLNLIWKEMVNDEVPGVEGAEQRRDAKGVEDDDDGDGDGDDQEAEARILPFQMVVSHVCKAWRTLALTSPFLWSMIVFRGRHTLKPNKVRTWINRSKGLPLDIVVDYRKLGDVFLPSVGLFEFRLDSFLEEMVGHVSKWRSLSFTCDTHDYVHVLLNFLSRCPPAPLLQAIHLEYAASGPPGFRMRLAPSPLPHPIFSGHAPRLKHVSLWDIHLNWHKSISLLSGARSLMFGFRNSYDPPSWTVFAEMIASCPEIQTLSLRSFGPLGNINGNQSTWGPDPLKAPSLKILKLGYHKPWYATSLVQKLSMPHLETLSLDYSTDGEDYTPLAQALTKPMPGHPKSLLAGLRSLKISGLSADAETVKQVLGQLGELRRLELNCANKGWAYFASLWQDCAGTSYYGKVLCPKLDTFVAVGVDPLQMKEFAMRRKVAGAPIKKLVMKSGYGVDEEREEWTRADVESFFSS